MLQLLPSRFYFSGVCCSWSKGSCCGDAVLVIFSASGIILGPRNCFCILVCMLVGFVHIEDGLKLVWEILDSIARLGVGLY